MEVFDLYFATIVGMNLHPGTTREGAKKLSLEECAALATEMLYVRRQFTCPSSQQQE